ncbi:MAG: hypothetical protein IIU51_03555, partial [Bacteroidaceae bacterium]|nr:hypothetical protein [Bacteroidaceae bacterium]
LDASFEVLLDASLEALFPVLLEALFEASLDVLLEASLEAFLKHPVPDWFLLCAFMELSALFFAIFLPPF